MDNIVINKIKEYLKNITQFNLNTDNENATIECRKLFDYIILNFVELKKNNQFINTIKNKLIEFENNKGSINYNIFYPSFYKKTLFEDEYGKLSQYDIKRFNNTRNKYYNEDYKIKKYFDKLLKIKIVNYNVINRYNIPHMVYI